MSDPNVIQLSSQIMLIRILIKMLIRLRIFLIFSVCVGLPVLILAFRFLHLHRKTRGRISAFIILLLVNDLMQLLMNVYTLTRTFTDYRFYFQFFESWPLILGGFLLHQLVALEGVLILKYPQFSAHFFSLPCYITTFIVVIVFFISITVTFVWKSFAHNFSLFFSLGSTLASLIVLAVTFTITCKAPPTRAIRNTHLVFAVAMVTFVLLYSPFMLVSCLHFIMNVSISWFEMPLCLLSLRLISDPLLCVAVCRENLRDVQTPETQTELRTD